MIRHENGAFEIEDTDNKSMVKEIAKLDAQARTLKREVETLKTYKAVTFDFIVELLKRVEKLEEQQQ